MSTEGGEDVPDWVAAEAAELQAAYERAIGEDGPGDGPATA